MRSGSHSSKLDSQSFGGGGGLVIRQVAGFGNVEAYGTIRGERPVDLDSEVPVVLSNVGFRAANNGDKCLPNGLICALVDYGACYCEIDINGSVG